MRPIESVRHFVNDKVMKIPENFRISQEHQDIYI